MDMKRLSSVVTERVRIARLMLMTSALCIAAASKGYTACTAATTHTISPTACGVVISTAGCYNMTPVNLTATTDAGDCIQITAPNVYLNLRGSMMTGTGATSTGNGVHVTSTATGATLVDAEFISGFNIGILAEARVRLESPLAQNNNSDGIKLINAASSKIVDGQSFSNGGNGVEILNSNAYVLASPQAESNALSGIVVTTSNSGDITNATATSNTLSGVTLNTATGTNISALNASNNSTYGLELISSKSNKIFPTTINSNGIYGVYLKESASNVLTGAGTSIPVNDNGVANVYLGCSDTTGPNGIACATASSSNEIDASDNDGGSATSYGIAIDLGNKTNTVVGSGTRNNTIDDAYDANLINQNTWFGNGFGSANQSFIH